MTDTDRLRDIAHFMHEFGFGRGDTEDAPHVEAAADEIDRLRAEAELYRRGFDLIGACDISNYLALCAIAGRVGEAVMHDTAVRMDSEREYRENNK